LTILVIIKEDNRMSSFVCVSDLIMYGGEGCTILHKKPYADHIVIVENECDCAYRGSVTITHDGETIVRRFMRGSDIMEPVKWLTVGDLDDARMELLKRRMCDGCIYFEECIYSGYKWCNCLGATWYNYKTGTCPEKSTIYKVIKVDWSKKDDQTAVSTIVHDVVKAAR
jgi:hypothetical protein